eukprot:6213799-Pleurochrysis_carterae.AAC.4
MHLNVSEIQIELRLAAFCTNGAVSNCPRAQRAHDARRVRWRAVTSEEPGPLLLAAVSRAREVYCHMYWRRKRSMHVIFAGKASCGLTWTDWWTVW